MSENWFAYVGPTVALLGLVLTIWWKVEGKIEAANARAERVERDLALQKLHTAEHYVSKAGLRETTEQLMEAISGVKAAVDNMTLRVDRIVEGQGRRTTTRG